MDRELKRSIDASNELEQELLRQYEELEERVKQHRSRLEVLERLADQATELASSDERLLVELAENLGIAPQLRMESLDKELRGRRLQEIAIEILSSRVEPGTKIHYREWFELVEAEGFRVVGKDPLASFLGQIGRSPQVVSAGRRSGLYMLVQSPETSAQEPKLHAA
jgi:hypothetical protein